MYVSHSSIRDLYPHINLIIDRGSRRHVVRCRTRNRVTLNAGVLYFLSIVVQVLVVATRQAHRRVTSIFSHHSGSSLPHYIPRIMFASSLFISLIYCPFLSSYFSFGSTCIARFYIPHLDAISGRSFHSERALCISVGSYESYDIFLPLSSSTVLHLLEIHVVHE